MVFVVKTAKKLHDKGLYYFRIVRQTTRKYSMSGHRRRCVALRVQFSVGTATGPPDTKLISLAVVGTCGMTAALQKKGHSMELKEM